MHRLTPFIRDVPDFPKPGIVFKDITPLLADPGALALAVEFMANPFRGKRVDVVLGAESRGFIFGIAVAQALSAGFVPVRKPGKLPRATVGESYALEYGTDRVEMHADAVLPGMRALIVDDLIATGGTLRACLSLARRQGGPDCVVGASVLIELTALKGREITGLGDALSAVIRV